MLIYSYLFLKAGQYDPVYEGKENVSLLSTNYMIHSFKTCSKGTITPIFIVKKTGSKMVNFPRVVL